MQLKNHISGNPNLQHLLTFNADTGYIDDSIKMASDCLAAQDRQKHAATIVTTLADYQFGTTSKDGSFKPTTCGKKLFKWHKDNGFRIAMGHINPNTSRMILTFVRDEHKGRPLKEYKVVPKMKHQIKEVTNKYANPLLEAVYGMSTAPHGGGCCGYNSLVLASAWDEKRDQPTGYYDKWGYNNTVASALHAIFRPQFYFGGGAVDTSFVLPENTQHYSSFLTFDKGRYKNRGKRFLTFNAEPFVALSDYVHEGLRNVFAVSCKRSSLNSMNIPTSEFDYDKGYENILEYYG